MQMSLDFSEVSSAHADDFLATIADFTGFGRKTAAIKDDGIPYFINEFWTAGQRQAHSLHEISYRACFKAQLPEFFIKRLTQKGDSVFDPFMGRGTTPIQAVLMGRNAFGNDVNPLAAMLARPRLQPINYTDIAVTLRSVDWSNGAIIRDDLLAFYHPATLRKLEAMRKWFKTRVNDHTGKIDPIADWIRMVAINRLSGHSPGFFSGRSMPPNQAISVKSQIKINEKLNLSPPERDIADIILKKTRSLLRNGCAPTGILSGLFTGPAWDTPQLPNESIDLVVTSPPFLDIVQYATDNWLRCWFADIDMDQVAIDIHKTEEAWTDMVRRVLTELERVVRPGGHVAFEVGEVRNGKILLEKLVWRAAEGLRFDRLCVVVNDQEFTKTANCWGVGNNSAGTNTNRIVLLRRMT